MTQLQQPAALVSRRSYRFNATADLADRQNGVCSRHQLRSLGISRDDVRCEVLAGRREALGKHTGRLRHSGDAEASWRRAIWETRGPAWLDGATALTAAGLTGWNDDTVHVSVPEDARALPVDGVHVHHLRERE